MPRFIICLTTTNKKNIADKIANSLIVSKTAACVNVIEGVSSTYRWKGKIQRDKEYIMIIKTELRKFNKVRAIIKQNHNYELPEILALEIKRGEPGYLKWLEECL